MHKGNEKTSARCYRFKTALFLIGRI